jgi:hypothetical protein
MTLQDIEAKLARLARCYVREGWPMRRIFPELVELSRESGRSLSWCQSAFSQWRNDVERGLA